MNQKTTIGLLSPYLAPFNAYELPASNLNVDLVVFAEYSVLWKADQVNGLVWEGTNWVRKQKPIPKGIYNRYYGEKLRVITLLESRLGKNKVFNHITHFDKWQVHQTLSKSALAPFLPAAEPYDPNDLVKFLDKYPRTIIKPTRGHLGNQIYLIEEEKQNYRIYRNTKYPVFTYRTKEEFFSRLEKIADSSFLMQQYLPLSRVEGRTFDLRFLVQKNGEGHWVISGVLSRLALKYSYVTNLVHMIIPGETALHESKLGRHVSISELEELSLKTAVVLETAFGSLGELSVDLGIDEQGHPWIIEVNGKPMKDMFKALDDSVLLRSVYETPLAYARFLARK